MHAVTIELYDGGSSISTVAGADTEVSIRRQMDGIMGDVSVVIHHCPADIRSSMLAATEGVCAVKVGGQEWSRFGVTSADWDARQDALRLTGGEGVGLWETKTVSLSFEPNTPAIEIAQAVAAASGLAVSFGEEMVFDRLPTTYSGLWRNAMTQVFGTQWTVTPAGVICGGQGAGVALDETSAFHVTRMRTVIDRDGKATKTVSVLLPALNLDVGGEANIRLPEWTGSGTIVGVDTNLGVSSQTTTIEVRI